MGLSLATAPTELPVTMQMAKRHLRVTDGDEDDLIRALIGGATDHAQTVTNRQMVSATYEYTLNAWEDVIYLPRPPLSSVTTVKYIDTDGVEQTLANTVYDVYTNTEPGFLRLGFNQSWPSIRSTQDAITVAYVAGYGDGVDVPEGLKAAIKLHVGHLFEHRESVDISTMARVTEVPHAYDAIIWGYKVPLV